MTSYDTLNNLPEISFTAGTDKTLVFTVYDENGLDLLNVVSAVWALCPYGEFGTTMLTKAGSIVGSVVTVSLTTVNTSSLSGKYIQQLKVVDTSGKTFITGQGTVIITPAISE
jgi:hypothetical protein